MQNAFIKLIKLEFTLPTAIWKDVLEHFNKIVRNYRLLIWVNIKGKLLLSSLFITE